VVRRRWWWWWEVEGGGVLSGRRVVGRGGCGWRAGRMLVRTMSVTGAEGWSSLLVLWRRIWCGCDRGVRLLLRWREGQRRLSAGS